MPSAWRAKHSPSLTSRSSYDPMASCLIPDVRALRWPCSREFRDRLRRGGRSQHWATMPQPMAAADRRCAAISGIKRRFAWGAFRWQVALGDESRGSGQSRLAFTVERMKSKVIATAASPSLECVSIMRRAHSRFVPCLPKLVKAVTSSPIFERTGMQWSPGRRGQPRRLCEWGIHRAGTAG